MADERISAEKILDATLIPCVTENKYMHPSVHESGTLTVAKKGPEKNPKKLTATASAMILETLSSSALLPRSSLFLYIQPEDQLQCDAQQGINEHHATLSESIRWLGKKESTQKTTTIKSRQDISNFVDLSVAVINEILDHPTCQC